MEQVLKIITITVFEPIRVAARFGRNPLGFYKTLHESSFSSTIALMLWSIPLARYVGGKKSEILALYFRGSRTAPEFYSVASAPLLGELISLVQITVYIFIATVVLRVWSTSWSEARNDHRSLQLFIAFIGLGFVYGAVMEIPAILASMGTEHSVSENQFTFMRGSQYVSQLIRFFITVALFINLRKLHPKLSSLHFSIGVCTYIIMYLSLFTVLTPLVIGILR